MRLLCSSNRTVSAVLAGMLAFAVGCTGASSGSSSSSSGGAGSSGGGSSGSTGSSGGGQAGWSFAYLDSSPFAVAMTFNDLAENFSAPDSGDPWFANATPRTVTLSESVGNASGDGSFQLTESGNTATFTLGVTVSASSDPNTATSTNVGAPAPFNICFTSPGANHIRFDFACSGTFSVSGSGVVFTDVDQKIICDNTVSIVNAPSWDPASGTFDEVAADGKACIGDQPDITLEGLAGGPNGAGSAQANVVVTITATPD